jgi:predicted DNA-binding transcriptional regulator AlpA
MARMVDLDDITDAAGVAEIIGLSKRNNVATYRARYDDFPEPVVNLGSGRCLLWLRSDVEAWVASRRGPAR